jgi:lon-related putative ATP-dependent protease
MKSLLNAKNIRAVFDPQKLDLLLKSNHSSQTIIGQDKAVKALHLGLGIRASGFNIYVSGEQGTGKLTTVKQFLEEPAKKEPIPFDWCYVNNFKDTYQPKRLRLSAGSAAAFKKDMKKLVQEVQQMLIKVFESEEFANRRKSIVDRFEEQQTEIMNKIDEHAQQESLIVKQTPMGIVTIPVKNKKPMTEEEFNRLSGKEVAIIKERQQKLMEDINESLLELRKKEKAANEELEKMAKQVAEYTIGNLIKEVREKYNTLQDVTDYLQSAKDDILDNYNEFMFSGKKENVSAFEDVNSYFLKRYEVNVLVDNTGQQGAPVVIERNPTYNNLLGRVEKESQMGALVTDFTMIRMGSLHKANGGYLIIRAEELFSNVFAWEGLKRALKNRELIIEDATDQLGYLSTRTVKPEPVPLDVKLILIGNPLYYRLLYQYDSDFKELFKIKADFDSVMDITDKNIHDYALLIEDICEKEKLLQPDNKALSKILEYSSRLADDQNKLSTCFGAIGDIVREASYYAVKENSANISSAHIIKAVEERKYRSNMVQQKIEEMICNNQILIDIKGEKTGQINGLSVISLGDITFGMPNRITCSTGMGKDGIIAIEREAEMSGPIHTKGVLILNGYLIDKFIQDKPVSLNAHIVFEQSYSEIEGDSASSTELYAILSALANLPIKQGIAVTGSVNQKGQVQAIGGVNEKIEGYFEVCRKMGFNGEQGVVIPAANLRNLMLKEEVLDAVEKGQFKLWAVDTIDEGIEILTGVFAGSKEEEGTVFYLVNKTLNTYAERMKAFAMEEGEKSKIISSQNHS